MHELITPDSGLQLMSDIIGIKCGGMPHKPRRTLPHLLKHTLIMLMPGPEGGSCRWVCNKLQSRKDGVLRTRDREQARRLHGWSVASQCPHVCRLAAALCFWSDATKDIQVAMLDPASMSKSPCRPIRLLQAHHAHASTSSPHTCGAEISLPIYTTASIHPMFLG